MFLITFTTGMLAAYVAGILVGRNWSEWTKEE
jgi:hypothetical protein